MLGKLLAACTQPPAGSTLIAYVRRHPAGGADLGGCVIRFERTGRECYWDGTAVRSLPPNWRELVEWEPVHEPDA